MGPTTRDRFAELFAAATFSDAGWNVYFPRWDDGIDFIIERSIAEDVSPLSVIRTVQVRGKYPTAEKGDNDRYGILNGSLSRVHKDMIVVMPFFDDGPDSPPSCVVYLPYASIKPSWEADDHKWSFSCCPCKRSGGKSIPRRDYSHLFNHEGLASIARRDWGTLEVAIARISQNSVVTAL
jgi:hypothetical protein